MPDSWMGLVHTFTGSNGTEIDLSSSGASVVLVNAELVGMGLPTYESYRTTAPGLAGSRYRGARTTERAVEIAFMVHSDEDTDEFLANDRYFWDLMGDPSLPVVWRVQTPDGLWRELTMRLSEDATGGLAWDTLEAGWVLYQLRFVADDPYWYGAPVELEFNAIAGTGFYTPPGTDVFSISHMLTTESVEIPNEGDVEAWITWTVVGPLEGLDLTLVSSGYTDGSLGIPDVVTGDTLVTYTDPRVATALLDGVDVTEQVIPWDPRPIPAKDTQTLVVLAVITGTGSLTATVRPRYRRAY